MSRAYKNQYPTLARGVYIDPTATVIGDVSIGAESSIWPMTSMRGDVNSIRIGRCSNIQDASVIHVSRPSANNAAGYPCVVGDNVTVGHKVVLHGCCIGNRVLVGMGAILLDGVIVEDEVVIGAGALVTQGKRLLSGYLYLGSPARQARALTAAERAYLVESANNYVALKNDYLEE